MFQFSVWTSQHRPTIQLRARNALLSGLIREFSAEKVLLVHSTIGAQPFSRRAVLPPIMLSQKLAQRYFCVTLESFEIGIMMATGGQFPVPTIFPRISLCKARFRVLNLESGICSLDSKITSTPLFAHQNPSRSVRIRARVYLIGMDCQSSRSLQGGGAAKWQIAGSRFLKL